MERKILFVDRDGVLNKKAAPHEYITSIEEFEFLPGTIAALQKLQASGYEIYVITNQAGVARGKMSVEDLTAIHEYMTQELQKNDISLAGIYYCPHGYNEGCECRKPKPGMLLQALREHDIDLARAIFVGDEDRDAETATAAGVSFIRVPSDVGIAGAVSKLIR